MRCIKTVFRSRSCGSGSRPGCRALASLRYNSRIDWLVCCSSASCCDFLAICLAVFFRFARRSSCAYRSAWCCVCCSCMCACARFNNSSGDSCQSRRPGQHPTRPQTWISCLPRRQFLQCRSQSHCVCCRCSSNLHHHALCCKSPG